MSENDFRRVINVPYRSEGTFGGDAMFLTIDLIGYLNAGFEKDGYRVTSLGIDNRILNLKLRRA